MATCGTDSLSLVSLLEASPQDIWWVLSGLRSKAHNRFVKQFLSNKLYEMDPEDLDFYLPQLWYDSTTSDSLNG